VKQLEEEILPAFLMNRRWYGAKDAGRPVVQIKDAVGLGVIDDPVLLILEVAPPGQPTQRYLLPIVVLWDGPEVPTSAVLAGVQAGHSRGILVDAFADDRFVRLLLTGISTGNEAVRQGRSGILFRRTAALAAFQGELGSEIERSTAEQSNTSVRVGGAMLKAFRKLEPGIHPELEVMRFLTDRAKFGNVPALLGSVEHVDASETATTLCVLQALVPNQGDGWSHTIECLERAVHDPDAGSGLPRFAGRLGQRTAELHHALATPTDEAAFAPEPVEDRHVLEWMDGVRAQARSALAGLEQARSRLDPAVGSQADRLLARSQELTDRIGQSTLVCPDVVRTRLHGDYHLGQVLVSGDDVFIIDFEGEPLRPLDARRAKHSPMRDVAGMLRSFAYAGAAARRGLQHGARSDATDALMLAMSDAFLAKYGSAIRGCPSFPANPTHAANLLRLFLLEKALYEVNYELANRPDWLGIPLSGVLALLDNPDAIIIPQADRSCAPLPTSLL
jgi:trehalose synthase-fused probable maltokinase